MKKISNTFYLGIITKLFIVIIVANLISLALLWYLPKIGVDMEHKKDYHSSYIRVDFKNMLQPKQMQSNGQSTTQNGTGIEDII